MAKDPLYDRVRDLLNMGAGRPPNMPNTPESRSSLNNSILEQLQDDVTAWRKEGVIGFDKLNSFVVQNKADKAYQEAFAKSQAEITNYLQKGVQGLFDLAKKLNLEVDNSIAYRTKAGNVKYVPKEVLDKDFENWLNGNLQQGNFRAQMFQRMMTGIGYYNTLDIQNNPSRGDKSPNGFTPKQLAEMGLMSTLGTYMKGGGKLFSGLLTDKSSLKTVAELFGIGELGREVERALGTRRGLMQSGLITGEGLGAGLGARFHAIMQGLNPFDLVTEKMAAEIINGVRMQGFRDRMAYALSDTIGAAINSMGTSVADTTTLAINFVRTVDPGLKNINQTLNSFRGNVALIKELAPQAGLSTPQAMSNALAVSQAAAMGGPSSAVGFTTKLFNEIQAQLGPGFAPNPEQKGQNLILNAVQKGWNFLTALGGGLPNNFPLTQVSEQAVFRGLKIQCEALKNQWAVARFNSMFAGSFEAFLGWSSQFPPYSFLQGLTEPQMKDLVNNMAADTESVDQKVIRASLSKGNLSGNLHVGTKHLGSALSAAYYINGYGENPYGMSQINKSEQETINQFKKALQGAGLSTEEITTLTAPLNSILAGNTPQNANQMGGTFLGILNTTIADLAKNSQKLADATSASQKQQIEISIVADATTKNHFSVSGRAKQANTQARNAGGNVNKQFPNTGP